MVQRRRPRRAPSSLSDGVVSLLIAYDGTRYAGWQRQRQAPTVQATVEAALQQLTGRRITTTVAGRTDAGVHAWGQVAHARLPVTWRAGALQRALNAILPLDILVRRVAREGDTFHARFQAVRKQYRYRIVAGPLRPLFERACAHYVPVPLDLAAMQRAATAWRGRHEFAAFHSSGRPMTSTRRTVYDLQVARRGGEIHVDIEADGFLYHMVRRMVGVLLEIGKGRWPVSVARAMLHPHPPVVAPTAPAKGLCLMRVVYG